MEETVTALLDWEKKIRTIANKRVITSKEVIEQSG